MKNYTVDPDFTLKLCYKIRDTLVHFHVRKRIKGFTWFVTNKWEIVGTDVKHKKERNAFNFLIVEIVCLNKNK